MLAHNRLIDIDDHEIKARFKDNKPLLDYKINICRDVAMVSITAAAQCLAMSSWNTLAPYFCPPAANLSTVLAAGAAGSIGTWVALMQAVDTYIKFLRNELLTAQAELDSKNNKIMTNNENKIDMLINSTQELIKLHNTLNKIPHQSIEFRNLLSALDDLIIARNTPHMQTQGKERLQECIMATLDSLSKYNDYIKGKLSIEPSTEDSNLRHRRSPPPS